MRGAGRPGTRSRAGTPRGGTLFTYAHYKRGLGGVAGWSAAGSRRGAADERTREAAGAVRAAVAAGRGDLFLSVTSLRRRVRVAWKRTGREVGVGRTRCTGIGIMDRGPPPG